MLQLDVNAILLVLIPLIGTAIGYMYDRSCKRRDARRAEMIELLQKQVADAEREADEAKAEAQAAIEKAQQEAREAVARAQEEARQQVSMAVAQERRQRHLALAYWQQLVKNGIEPIVAIADGEAE